MAGSSVSLDSLETRELREPRTDNILTDSLTHLPAQLCLQRNEYQKLEDKIAAVNGALSVQEMMTMILY